MVSLAETGHNRAGAYSFLDHSPDDTMETENIDGDTLPLRPENFVMTSYRDMSTLIRFKPIRLHWTIALNLLLYVVYLGVVLGVPFSISNSHRYPAVQTCSRGQPSNDSDVYFGYFSAAHVGLCVIEAVLFLVQFSLLYQLRRRGYYKFFNSTWWLLGIPLVLSVFVDGILLILMSLAYSLKIGLCSMFTGQLVWGYVLLSVTGLESVLGSIFQIIFCVRCIKFNSRQLSPDSLQSVVEERQSGAVVPPSVGFRESSHTDTIIERQADTIRYLQQHNASLAKKILQLQQDDNNRF